MNNFKKNLLSVYGVNLINGLCGIMFVPLALKGLGAEGYGLYSIFTIMSSYIYFSELGTTKYFTRILARDKDILIQKKHIQLAVSIYLRLAGALVLLTPIMLYLIPKYVFPVHDSENIISIIIIYAIVDYLLSLPTAIILMYNIGNEKFLKVSKYNLISGISRHSLLIISVLVSDSVIFLMNVYLLRRIIDFYYSIKLLDKIPLSSWKPNYQKGEFKRVISQSIYLSMSQILQVSVIALGTYLVNKHFTLQEVGLYKSSFDIATKVWFISNGLGLVIFPRFAAITADKSQVKNFIKKLKKYNLLSWVVFNIIFLIGILCLPLLKFIFPIQDEMLFGTLLLGTCLNAHANFSYEFLQAGGYFKTVILVNLFSPLVMLIGFYIFIDYYGLLSVGVSWGISQIFYSISLDIMAFKNYLSINQQLKLLLINLVLLFISIFVFLSFVSK